MDDITTKTNYDGTTIPVPDTAVHEASEYNDRKDELQGAVEDSSQTLDVADPTQLSKAIFANGVAAQSMIDSGGVNTVVLTPITGPNGFRVAVPVISTYDLLDGAIFNFQANNTNIGNMTINVGQTGGTLIGAVPLFLEDGTTDIPVGRVVSSLFYNIIYDSSLDGGSGAFVLLLGGVNTGYVDDRTDPTYSGGESHPLVGGLILKMGSTGSGVTSQTIVFAIPFPTALISVVTQGVRSSGTGEQVTHTITKNGFSIRGISPSDDYHWIAIGH